LTRVGDEDLRNIPSASDEAGHGPDASDGQPQHRPVYSIGAVARMLGIPAATLRNWQERYGVVVPERSEGGHRLYTRDQVEQLRFLVDQVATGMSAADAHRMLRDRFDAGLSVPPPASAGGDRLLILLAERDPFAAEFAEYFLRTEGFEVALVLSADDAVSMTAEAEPDLAVVELLISSGRGLELCRRMHRDHGIPVLAISTIELRDKAMAAGASAFLLKPIEPLQLVSVVQDLLGHSAFLRRDTRRDGRQP
jgi:DNA-binding transcriptional MerR regulator